MIKRDTTKQAQEVVTQIYRHMTACQKMSRIMDAYNTGKAIAQSRLRRMNPDTDEKIIWQLWAKKHLGNKLFEKIYGKTQNG